MEETVQAGQQDGHFNESIMSEEILEDLKKNRIDHMKYLPDMEQLEESDVMDQVISTMNAYDYDKYTEADVRRALAHDNRTPEDFQALLSPAALPLLEEIAQAARKETRKHFGNSICMFTPIYIANYCENYCIYCGFNCHNKIRRAQLNEDEIEKEMAAIAATDVTAEQKINGVNNGWAGIRVPYEYVQKYFNARNADYTTGEYTVNDKRGGMFYIKGRQESMNDALYVFLNGWTCLKFNNIPHDMTNDEFLATAASKAYSDIDFPMIRLGEIYLIYAEACMNLGQANTALPKLKELTDRAGVSAPSSVTADYLLEERARELMWEGHRRTDLIRYGKFTTPSFLWTYKGGTFTGQGFDDYMKIFAIPSSELASNPELHQNPGYGNATDK